MSGCRITIVVKDAGPGAKLNPTLEAVLALFKVETSDTIRKAAAIGLAKQTTHFSVEEIEP